jgi:Ca-activated chloride channel family protein
MFAGTQVVLVGQYTEAGWATIRISGIADGERQTFAYERQQLVAAGEKSEHEALPRLWATRKIGYLLNQIRLNGENQEWIAAIIDLSVTYGIVTPYTAYLITEDDVLTQAGRQELAAAEFDEAQKTAEPVSGSGAVDAAVSANSLQQSAQAAPAMIERDGEAAVRVIGSRAFVERGGVWIETTFDPSLMTATPIMFASDAYFALLDAHPEMSAAFALGERVIAQAGGTWYEVTSAD